MIFIHRQEAVLLHFPQLVGKSAAIDAQVIRQLLPVERNREIQAFVPRGLIGQVGNQAPPDGLGRGMENPAGQIQVFWADIVSRLRMSLLWWRQALGQVCRIRAPFRNKISEGSEATAVTMSGSSGIQA